MLSTNNDKLLDKKEIENLQNYIRDSKETNQQLLDMVGILNDHIKQQTNNNKKKLSTNQKYQLKLEMDKITEDMIEYVIKN